MLATCYANHEELQLEYTLEQIIKDTEEHGIWLTFISL
jgi:hypothetical protein